MVNTTNPIPSTGFLRLKQIIGDPKSGIPPIIPISKVSWYAGVKSGKYPKSVRLGKRTVAWLAEDIKKLIEEAA